MGIGFEAYDASGRLMFSASDRLGRVLGIIDIPAASAPDSLTDADLLNGDGYALFFRNGSGNDFSRCVISVSGQTISWSFAPTGNQAWNPGGFILYGIR